MSIRQTFQLPKMPNERKDLDSDEEEQDWSEDIEQFRKSFEKNLQVIDKAMLKVQTSVLNMKQDLGDQMATLYKKQKEILENKQFLVDEYSKK